ncbi:hypothetical protein Angca_001675, partial [Angiostrongylus cantonensis]
FSRYVTISKFRNRFALRHRLAISAIALAFSVIAKLPIKEIHENITVAFYVVANGNCTGITSLTAIVSEFSEQEPYKTTYKFWLRSIVTIILPFVLCFCFNIGIIRSLRIQHKRAKLFRFATSEHRKNVRSATLMLVCVTCTYLASNTLNVIVYSWELIDKVCCPVSFGFSRVNSIYSFNIPLCMPFSVLAFSACRLPIYFVCNARIRSEVME